MAHPANPSYLYAARMPVLCFMDLGMSFQLCFTFNSFCAPRRTSRTHPLWFAPHVIPAFQPGVRHTAAEYSPSPSVNKEHYQHLRTPHLQGTTWKSSEPNRKTLGKLKIGQTPVQGNYRAAAEGAEGKPEWQQQRMGKNLLPGMVIPAHQCPLRGSSHLSSVPSKHLLEGFAAFPGAFPAV